MTSPPPPGVASECADGRKAAAESREAATSLGRLAASLEGQVKTVAASLEDQLMTVAATLETHAKTVATLTDGLTRSERDGLARFKVRVCTSKRLLCER